MVFEILNFCSVDEKILPMNSAMHHDRAMFTSALIHDHGCDPVQLVYIAYDADTDCVEIFAGGVSDEQAEDSSPEVVMAIATPENRRAQLQVGESAQRNYRTADGRGVTAVVRNLGGSFEDSRLN